MVSDRFTTLEKSSVNVSWFFSLFDCICVSCTFCGLEVLVRFLLCSFVGTSIKKAEGVGYEHLGGNIRSFPVIRTCVSCSVSEWSVWPSKVLYSDEENNTVLSIFLLLVLRMNLGYLLPSVHVGRELFIMPGIDPWLFLFRDNLSNAQKKWQDRQLPYLVEWRGNGGEVLGIS